MTSARSLFVITLLASLAASGCHAVAGYQSRDLSGQSDAGPADGALNDQTNDGKDPHDAGATPISPNWGKWTGEVCKNDWCWEHPLPQGGALNAIWMASKDEAFAVGVRGLILHFDGHAWQQMETPVDATLNGVSGVGGVGGSSPTKVFAVGDGGVILRLEGTTWKIDDTNTNTRSLYDVWVYNTGEAFAVGRFGTILRYDGRGWSGVDADLGNNHLYSVWGDNNGGAIAVGNLGTVLNYDSKASPPGWTKQTTGITESLHGVWGDTPLGPVVVGDGPKVLTRSGLKWNTLPINSDLDLTDVWGSSSALMAVGIKGETLAYEDGKWISISVAAPAGFLGIYGVKDGPMIAVGPRGNVFNFDRGWKKLLPAQVTSENLYAISAVSKDDVFAAGNRGTVMRRDRNGWTRLNQNSTTVRFRGAWASSATNAYFVGDKKLLHLESGKYVDETPSGLAGALNAIWGRGKDEIYTVGASGAFFKWDGSSWEKSKQAPPSSKDFSSVWSDDPTRIFTAGGGGNTPDLHIYNQSTWAQQNVTNLSPKPRWLNSVRGFFNELYITGEGGFLYRQVGKSSAWTKLDTKTHHVNLLWGDDRVLYGVGSLGSVYRVFDSVSGDLPRREIPPYTSTLRGISGEGPGPSIWVVGDYGTILRRRPPPP